MRRFAADTVAVIVFIQTLAVTVLNLLNQIRRNLFPAVDEHRIRRYHVDQTRVVRTQRHRKQLRQVIVHAEAFRHRRHLVHTDVLCQPHRHQVL